MSKRKFMFWKKHSSDPLSMNTPVSHFVSFFKHRSIKPILISVISALFIGGSMGMIMLNMMINLNETTPSHQPLNASEGEQVAETTEHSSHIVLDSLQAYVIQGGVFSEESNAKEVAKQFKQKGFRPFIWSTEEGVYLFIGIFETKEEAEAIKPKLDEASLDYFIKNWSTPEIEVRLTADEEEWVNTLQETWTKSIKQLSENTIPVTHWEQLLEEFPEDSEKFVNLKESMNELLKEDLRLEEMQYLLLAIWDQLTNL